jgi:hypothetical protein
VGGKRVPDGDAIKGYFPAIVDEQLFYRAQDARDQRRVRGAGRKGRNVSNLFSGLATCAYCGSKMRFENKGPGPKGGTYVVCDSARRGLKCEKTAWRYDHFEASFLAFVREVDLERVMQGGDEARQRSILEERMTALRGEQAAIGQQMDKTYELLGMAGTPGGPSCRHRGRAAREGAGERAPGINRQRRKAGQGADRTTAGPQPER